VEQELPGDGCSSADLDVLFDVGRTLGKLYAVMYEFEHMPGQILPLGDWIDLTLRKAETWAAERHHDEYVRALRSQIRNDHRNFRIRFGLVHGDLRAPNVLRHGQSLGLIDFNCKYDRRCCMNHIAGMVFACCLFVSCFFLSDTIRVCPDGSFD
jgi:Ser/Thr protein kinase RdoA (MazF antagonist)